MIKNPLYKLTSWPRRLRIVTDIAKAMNFLHSIRIPTDSTVPRTTISSATDRSRLLHKFLTSGSVLVDSDLNAKISIPYYGRCIKRYTPHMVESLDKYMSPEVIFRSEFSTRSDVYAFSIIMYEMAAFAMPYDGMPTQDILYSVSRAAIRPGLENVPDSCPSDYITLMTECWSQEASNRPTFPEILRRLDRLLGQCLCLENDVAGSYVPTRRSTLSKMEPAHVQYISDYDSRHDNRTADSRYDSRYDSRVVEKQTRNVPLDYHYNSIVDAVDSDDEHSVNSDTLDTGVPSSYLALCKELKDSEIDRYACGLTLPPPLITMQDVDMPLSVFMSDDQDTAPVVMTTTSQVIIRAQPHSNVDSVVNDGPTV